MTTLSNDSGSEDLVRRLRVVGFAATANDMLHGHIGYGEVVHRLRRDAENVTEPTRSARLGLANELELRLEVSRLADGLGDLVGRLHRLSTEVDHG